MQKAPRYDNRRAFCLKHKNLNRGFMISSYCSKPHAKQPFRRTGTDSNNKWRKLNPKKSWREGMVVFERKTSLGEKFFWFSHSEQT